MAYILIAEHASNPRVHDTPGDAMKEAERLCRKEKCRIFMYQLIGETRAKESPVEFISHKISE